MNEALDVYMRASLLARNIERMECWSREDLVLAFHCRDNPPFETFCQRVGIKLDDSQAEQDSANSNAEMVLGVAKLLSKHESTKNIVSIEEVKPKRKAKRGA